MASASKPPSFVRSGSSSMSMHAPTSAVGSFAATNRSASTPQGTPPPPPHLANMDNNAPVMIYTAVYSGVPVFEMTVNNIAVMRRRDDSWLNATQILKVAGVEKGKRTKVLEKEILIGKHEKVQGGYGKYQGTWIDFGRGRDFCRAYGVDGLLAPLLDLDVKAAGGADSTPTKEQAMAAKRKRMYNPSLNKANGSSGPVFPISSAVTSAFNALSKSKSRKESPVPRPARIGSAPSSQTVRQEMASQEPRPPPPPPSLSSEPSFSYSQATIPDSAYASQNVVTDSQQTEILEPPRKRARASTPLNEFPVDHYPHRSGDMPRPLPPLGEDSVPNSEQVKENLLNVFVHKDIDAMLALDGVTVDQVDMRLDVTGNAAIHWAASLALVPVLRALVAKGASIYRVNDAGETALVRGCTSTNNFDNSSFPQLLNLLHPTISIADNTGRTLLHHIALKSGMKGRSADGRYYLHCLLEFVAKHGASSSNQRNSGQKVMNLGKFITDIVNAQDKSGDTALNIAARIGNKSIVQQLLEVGADSSIPNRAGLRPVDFGIGGEPAPIAKGREQAWTVPPAVIQKREDIVKGMKETIAGIEKDFQAEVERKHKQNEATLQQLREVTRVLGKEREKANLLSQRSREHAELRQHCQNLRRAITEEGIDFRENFGTMNGVIPGVKEGESNPDLPYALRTHLLPSISDPSSLSPQQRDYLRSLPPSAVLKARVKAYRANDENLRDRAAKLRERSTDLEEKFRRVVALCTGVPEDRVDSLLESLVQAVESDPGEVDTARVSTFLRKVDESTGPD